MGPLPWLGPQTGEVLDGLAKQGHKHAMAVPIAFTTDHIETLFEIDVEYREEAEKAGMEQFERSPSLNDDPLIVEALAHVVKEHLDRGEACSSQYAVNCAQCVNPTCRTIINPVAPYTRLRDEAQGLATPSTTETLQG